MGIAQIFGTAVSFYLVCPSAPAAQKSGQNITVLPGWRENLFRGLLFCDCCGHPLTLSRKELKDREVDIYLCTHHNRRPDECPKTHIIYHEELYPYMLAQIRMLARSMKRRKVNSSICQYVDIQELTPVILREIVQQITIKHMSNNKYLRTSINICWRLV